MDDLISRKAAINLLKKWSDGYAYIEHETKLAIEAFEELPSAQPKIVMCKDYKYGQAHNPDGSIICEHWDDNAVSDDDFCSYAERRTDG